MPQRVQHCCVCACVPRERRWASIAAINVVTRMITLPLILGNQRSTSRMMVRRLPSTHAEGAGASPALPGDVFLAWGAFACLICALRWPGAEVAR